MPQFLFRMVSVLRAFVIVLCLGLTGCVSSKHPEALTPVAASAPGARSIHVHVATTRVPDGNGYFTDKRGRDLAFQHVRVSSAGPQIRSDRMALRQHG